MGDERCEIGPHMAVKGSLENQCSMSSNTTTTNTPTAITTTADTTHRFSTNTTNNSNNNNNEEQDRFLPITTTTNNTHHYSTNASINTSDNKNNEQDPFLPIPTTTNNTHPFSTIPNNNNSTNNKEQDRFLPISTSTNNIQHFSSNATTKSSSNSNKEQDRFPPISTSTNNTQHFSTNASHSNNSSSTTINNKEQDRFLPIANVGRIMKKFIPGNGKISKDAKETVQECVSEFISFVTGEASDKCQREKRKTINGDDIIWAITTLGFEDYVTPLKQYLNKYRELEGEKLNVPKPQRLQQHDQMPNMSYHSVYSSTSLLSQPSFVPNDQPFPLPFSQNSIQTQLPQHEHIDSVGNW